MVLSISVAGFMYRVRWPCASRSIKSTRWPSSAKAAPRLTAVVVLPTPPFCMATAIVRAKIGPSLTEAGKSYRSTRMAPPCDHRRNRRPHPHCRPDRRLSARRDPAADGGDLLFRHPAGGISVPRPVRLPDAEVLAPQHGA